MWLDIIGDAQTGSAQADAPAVRRRKPVQCSPGGLRGATRPRSCTGSSRMVPGGDQAVVGGFGVGLSKPWGGVGTVGQAEEVPSPAPPATRLLPVKRCLHSPFLTSLFPFSPRASVLWAACLFRVGPASCARGVSAVCCHAPDGIAPGGSPGDSGLGNGPISPEGRPDPVRGEWTVALSTGCRSLRGL